MSTIDQYLNYGDLALASYGVQLASGGSNTAKYQEAGMAISQANSFDQRWLVLSQTDIGVKTREIVHLLDEQLWSF